ncbi:orotidine-5'-phosphate decarboxylase [Fimbriiglobus ruber]|uniref:Orotidine 5'-phosphate decarboxylase n=1 Tax=Fimbriiglobus ruber TaxID=1908690 RepID=A0A225DIH9_9BACT|nr:orotidine-5'-phosphate decarboxylase [Fimbriiglobus ruber]OWK36175.1 Orotidine 5'-phosphate decarboxylase [Fimbriiglobus ruber]
MLSFPDRLADAVRKKGPLCVGIDPRWDALPTAIREVYADLPPADRAAAAVLDFGLRVLELVAPFAGVVKPQSAFFELLGPPGMRVLQELLIRANDLGFVTILDAKRGDIASTATAYADAAFAGAAIDNEVVPVWDADSLTVNPYLGEDAVEPFVTAARASGRGLFVLVRTSNAGAGLFQNLVCDGKPIYLHVGEAVARWNANTIGQCGLGAIGAVVGATHPRELVELRAALPNVWFLVPGYGAQGGTAADIRAAYRPDGLGAVVNSSRGVTFPFRPDDPAWEAKVTEAARKASAELRS